MGKSITVKEAGREDIPVVLEFIRGLAEYEKLKHEVEADEETLKREMFVKAARGRSLPFAAKHRVGLRCIFIIFQHF